MIIKARVNKNLNIRTEKPEILPYNNPDNAYYKPGDEIEIAEIIPGEEYKNNKTWYKLSNGTYVWSGGVDNIAPKDHDKDENIKHVKVNYNELVNLPDDFKSTKGENVVIAVLDTGCYVEHSDLHFGIISGYDAISDKNEIIDESTKGHGTFVSGIIAGNTTSNGIIGVAPKAQIMPIRVIRKTAVTPGNVIKGLQWLINESPITPDIINMSFDVSSDIDKSEFENTIVLARNKDILIVAAGQDYDTINKKGIYYPAENPNIIAIATLDYNIINKPDFKGVNKKIDFLIPKYTYFSTNNITPYSYDEGSSFATAAITGAIALVISYKKKKQIQDNAITTLKDLLPSFDKKLFENNFKIWKT